MPLNLVAKFISRTASNLCERRSPEILSFDFKKAVSQTKTKRRNKASRNSLSNSDKFCY
ncbi:hypothetical protein CAMRE0001_2519 [Campylobacter rectus RM3267]|uniref:Uncharacterized protein n=1 Tax=Campylobacter rectus RM3267 TaxID=553218 RepID=B9D3Q5_CAMRE|nr:hypothetical protein CAMRE0001_2519 [Campylobacter rectus RM3267]